MERNFSKTFAFMYVSVHVTQLMTVSAATSPCSVVLIASKQTNYCRTSTSSRGLQAHLGSLAASPAYSQAYASEHIACRQNYFTHTCSITKASVRCATKSSNFVAQLCCAINLPRQLSIFHRQTIAKQTATLLSNR